MHTAIEMLDWFFLATPPGTNDCSLDNLRRYAVASFLLASKYDELDNNIPIIKELQRFLSRT